MAQLSMCKASLRTHRKMRDVCATPSKLVKIFSCLLVSLGWVSLAAAQYVPTTWSWEFVASHVPQFEGKIEESKKMLVVEIIFRNNTSANQKLIMTEEAFQAATQKARRVEIRGLLFRMQKLEGAKRMSYRGGMKRMETLSEVQGNSSTLFIHSPGPVEVVVESGQSYKQWLLLTRPKGKKPFRLKFNDLPELEVSIPNR